MGAWDDDEAESSYITYSATAMEQPQDIRIYSKCIPCSSVCPAIRIILSNFIGHENMAVHQKLNTINIDWLWVIILLAFD